MFRLMAFPRHLGEFGGILHQKGRLERNSFTLLEVPQSSPPCPSFRIVVTIMALD